MNIIHINDIEDCKNNKPFAVYDYDEVCSKKEQYINIREIVTSHRDQWLNDIQESFAQLSGDFLKQSRWWWVTGASRLDLRPWGQEDVFKPLFFARALLQWAKSNTNTNSVYVVGAPVEVTQYLKDLNTHIIVDDARARQRVKPFLLTFSWCLVIGFLKFIKSAGQIVKDHLFAKAKYIKADTLVLYELIGGMTLENGWKYYYDGLFDNKPQGIAYGCIDNISLPTGKLRAQATKDVFFLLDNISFGDFLRCAGINLKMLMIIVGVCIKKRTYMFGDYQTKQFWPVYLAKDMARMPFFKSLCCYYALKTVSQSHLYKKLIYTYEEKPLERAILFAAGESGIQTIGYVPHPQHRLALFLRDTHKPLAPKPGRYAVCGDKYIPYFESWCQKDPQTISVWGSQKAIKKEFVVKSYDRNNINVLLTLSHPNELKVFASWLKSEQRLRQGIHYQLRIYGAAGEHWFENQLNIIMGQYDRVSVTTGSLSEDLSQCDVAAFCGTSAGLMAVNSGYVAIHLGLDDFFQMNPCFDDTKDMLTSLSAAQFADRLDALCSMSKDELFEIYTKQLNLVEEIFHPIEARNMEEDFNRCMSDEHLITI